jgi:hypothetical protein
MAEEPNSAQSDLGKNSAVSAADSEPMSSANP